MGAGRPAVAGGNCAYDGATKSFVVMPSHHDRAFYGCLLADRPAAIAWIDATGHSVQCPIANNSVPSAYLARLNVFAGDHHDKPATLDCVAYHSPGAKQVGC